MSLTELQAELDSERDFSERLLAEKAEALQALEMMADAAHCIAESFRMTLQAHGLRMDGHRKAFSRYHKAREQYEHFCTGK
jgi:hypothetical protein